MMINVKKKEGMGKNKKFTERKEKGELKVITVRNKKDLINQIKEKCREYKTSLNSYINSVLNSTVEREEPLYKEIMNKLEKKEVESRVHFTKSEADLLRKYAAINGWSLSKEIRYRVISSLAKKPKLNKEELKAIYSVRSSINVLGANINRLVKDSKSLADDNMEICKDLIESMKELKAKIYYLEKCSYSNFKLKDGEDKNES